MEFVLSGRPCKVMAVMRVLRKEVHSVAPGLTKVEFAYEELGDDGRPTRVRVVVE